MKSFNSVYSYGIIGMALFSFVCLLMSIFTSEENKDNHITDQSIKSSNVLEDKDFDSIELYNEYLKNCSDMLEDNTNTESKESYYEREENFISDNQNVLIQKLKEINLMQRNEDKNRISDKSDDNTSCSLGDVIAINKSNELTNSEKLLSNEKLIRKSKAESDTTESSKTNISDLNEDEYLIKLNYSLSEMPESLNFNTTNQNKEENSLLLDKTNLKISEPSKVNMNFASEKENSGKSDDLQNQTFSLSLVDDIFKNHESLVNDINKEILQSDPITVSEKLDLSKSNKQVKAENPNQNTMVCEDTVKSSNSIKLASKSPEITIKSDQDNEKLLQREAVNNIDSKEVKQSYSHIYKDVSTLDNALEEKKAKIIICEKINEDNTFEKNMADLGLEKAFKKAYDKSQNDKFINLPNLKDKTKTYSSSNAAASFDDFCIDNNKISNIEICFTPKLISKKDNHDCFIIRNALSNTNNKTSWSDSALRNNSNALFEYDNPIKRNYKNLDQMFLLNLMCKEQEKMSHLFNRYAIKNCFDNKCD